jgi:staphylococcal nuclease domain-containing protein 1
MKVFIDYGNSESVKFSSIRSIGQSSFSALPGQAKDATLSFVTLPTRDADYGAETQNAFEELTGTNQLVANVDHRGTNGVMSLTLWNPKKGRDGPDGSINADMVRLGFARVFKQKKRTWEKAYGDILDILEKEEKEAKFKRAGMWEYGHIGDSDED